MQLADLVATSATVAATRSRKAKVAALAARLGAATAEELPIVTSYLGGALLQRRTGLGWRSLAALPAPAPVSSLGVAEVHDAFGRISLLAGEGSQAARAAEVASLFGRATADEQAWLRGLVTGELRQGALDSLVQEGLAVASGRPLAVVRRAAMLAGSTVAIAPLAFADGLDAVTLEVGRPVLPMLASSAPTVAEGVAKAGGHVAVDAKLDGIRVQVHRDDDRVVIATRTLDDITHRLPEVVQLARSLPARRFVLDGEAISVDGDGRPRPFQETASRTASTEGAAVSAFFFDVLHIDDLDLIDAPLRERLDVLDGLVPEQHRVGRVVTDDPGVAEAFAREVLARGHEGVVVKNLEAPWEAGRRGAGWVKVKPVHTLDLVVLAVEWGSGRRRGWLSNIHLGARDPERPGGFVMLGKTFEETGLQTTGWVPVGKTFKGMSDEMLTWQTERFQELKVADDGRVVTVRPEQVVEIACDGVQRSTRYPGGVALRFARVVRYRDDKSPADADTIAALREFLR